MQSINTQGKPESTSLKRADHELPLKVIEIFVIWIQQDDETAQILQRSLA